MPETIPEQTSNAGPEYRIAAEECDWRDFLWAADEDIRAARRMEQSCESMDGSKRNASRIAAIDNAIEALQESRRLLCR